MRDDNRKNEKMSKREIQELESDLNKIFGYENRPAASPEAIELAAELDKIFGDN